MGNPRLIDKKTFRRRVILRIAGHPLTTWSAVASAAAVTVAMIGNDQAIPLFVACGFLAQFPFSVYYLFSTQILPPKFRGTAYAFNNTISIIGGAVSPALAGLLLDVTGSFFAAFLMMAVTALLGLVLLAAVRER